MHTTSPRPVLTSVPSAPQRCWEPPPGAALVFNCQMGRGRTTTGMIIASLLHLRKAAPPPFKLPPAVPLREWAGQGLRRGGLGRCEAGRGGVACPGGWGFVGFLAGPGV